MKKALFVLLGSFLSVFVRAQAPEYPHSVRFSVSQTSIAPKEIGEKTTLQWELIFAKKRANKRTFAEVSLGYLSYYKRQQISPFPFYYRGDHAQRISATARLMYDFLKSPVHSFRAGGGLSGWYQKDNLARNLSVVMNSTMNEVTSIFFRRVPYHRVSAGYVITVEYDYTITSHITLGAKLEHLDALVYPYQSAIPANFSMAGVSIGYRF